MEIQDLSDCLSPEAQNVAEARLTAKRAARAEAREIRMKELERQQKEVEERPEKDFAEKGSRPVSSLSAATLASLGGTSSRRGSGDTSVSVDTEASIREIKDSLAEVEEKYKRSMVTNAQLDNEKTSLVYQVDSLREVLLELEEELAESRRQYDDKHKECERQKHEHNVLHFQLTELKDTLQQREEMLTALERQKEFFDPVRSERDELREEVARLKAELKKSGGALISRDTLNGDSSLEPHINTECLDPPLQGTSLGKTKEGDVRKEEEISVACQVPRSGSEQDRNETQANAPEEVSVHTESRGSNKEPSDLEVASGGNRVLEPMVSDESTLDGLQTSSNMRPEDSDSENKCRENADENLKEQDIGKGDVILDQCVTEVGGNLKPSRTDISPTGSEEFQDALDFVAQNPDPAALQEALSVSLNAGNDNGEGQTSQQEAVFVDSIRFEDNKVEEKADFTPESILLDSPVQNDDKEDNSQGDHITNPLSEEFPENRKEPSNHNEFSEENVGDVVPPCDESSMDQEPTKPCENKSKEYSDPPQRECSQNENTAKNNEVTVLVDQKNTDDPLTSSESREGDGEEIAMAVHIIPSAGNEIQLDQDKSPLPIDQPPQETSLGGEDAAVDQYEAQGDVKHVATESQDGGVKDITEDVTSGTDLGCESKNLSTEKKADETPDLEKREEGNNTPHEDVVPESNGKKRVDSTHSMDENPSETSRNESLSSDGENSQEEDSDTNEDHAGPTEKYPGEREMPRIHIGSSVDGASSSEDVRVEDGEEKTVKRGKGKNKEDCLLS